LIRNWFNLIIKNCSISGYTQEVSDILNKLDQDLAIQQLVNLLEQPDFFASSIKILTELDKVTVLRYLSNRLGSGTPGQQERAVEAMGLIGSKNALPYLEKVIEGGFAANIIRAAKMSIQRLNKTGS